MRQQRIEFCLYNGYHSRSLPIIPRMSPGAKFTHFSQVSPHKINQGSPIATSSVSSWHIIAAATDVKVFPRPISSATSTPGKSESQTHLLTMSPMVQTWCARNLVLGRPGTEYLWPRIQLSLDWRIVWVSSSLTASSRHSWSNLLLIVSTTVFIPVLVFYGLGISSPSSPCF